MDEQLHLNGSIIHHLLQFWKLVYMDSDFVEYCTLTFLLPLFLNYLNVPFHKPSVPVCRRSKDGVECNLGSQNMLWKCQLFVKSNIKPLAILAKTSLLLWQHRTIFEHGPCLWHCFSVSLLLIKASVPALCRTWSLFHPWLRMVVAAPWWSQRETNRWSTWIWILTPASPPHLGR